MSHYWQVHEHKIKAHAANGADRADGADEADEAADAVDAVDAANGANVANAANGANVANAAIWQTRRFGKCWQPSGKRREHAQSCGNQH